VHPAVLAPEVRLRLAGHEPDKLARAFFVDESERRLGRRVPDGAVEIPFSHRAGVG